MGGEQSFEKFITERLTLILNLTKEIEKLQDEQLTYIGFHFKKEGNEYRNKTRSAQELMLKGENLTNEDRVEIAKTILKFVDIYKKYLIQPLQEVNNKLQMKLLDFKMEIKNLSGFEKKFKNIPETKRQGLKNIIQLMNKLLKLSQELHSARILATNSIIKVVETDEKLPALTIAHGGKIEIKPSKEMIKEYMNNVVEYNTLAIISWNKEKELNKEFKKLIKELHKIK